MSFAGHWKHPLQILALQVCVLQGFTVWQDPAWLWLSSGCDHRQGPKPLAHVCGRILQVFGKGQSHLGHTQHPGLFHSWLLQLVLVGMDVWVLGGTVPAAGMLARYWPAPECPWGSDVQDNLKSLSLCDLASCRRFCPWLFWEHGGAAPRHTFLALATRGFCQELPQQEPWAQWRDMSHVDQAQDIPIPLWAAHV